MFGYGLATYFVIQGIRKLYSFALDTNDSKIIDYSQLHAGQYIDKKFLGSVLRNYQPNQEQFRALYRSIHNPIDREMTREIKIFF